MRNDSRNVRDKQLFTVKEGSPLPIGVSRIDGGVNFSVDVPEGNTCRLLIYQKGQQTPCCAVSMKEGHRLGEVCAIALTGFDFHDYEYNYEINGKVCADPYAKRLVGREQFGKYMPDGPEKGNVRCSFIFDDYDWEADAPPQIPLHEVIAYKLHVRGFTKHSSSKVKHKGTFLGMIEKIPYLSELGVNQIELMPAYEFDEITTLDDSFLGTGRRMNYWGYGPGLFFAPKASYAAGPDPAREFKDLVKACHKAGIEVIMEFYFPAGTRGFMALDCIRFWAMEYHVDGFHLNAEAVPMDALITDPILSGLKYYAGSFDVPAGEKRKKRLAIYQEGFLQTARRLLKSDEDQLRGFVYHISEQPEQTGIINYVAGHNGFTLLDLVSYDQKHNEANGEDNRDGINYNFSWNCGEEGPTRKKKIMALRKRQMKNALAMLYLSQGIPMLLAGDEMGNSQNGNNNAYCLDNEISWIEWNRPAYQEIREYTKKLIAIRRGHEILHRPEKLRMMDVSGCGFPDLSFHGSKAWYAEMDNYNRHIGIMYCDGKKAEKGGICCDFLYIAYNLHWVVHSFALPNLPRDMEWCVLLDTGAEESDNVISAEKAKVLEDQRELIVQGRTVVLLCGRKIM